MTVKEIYRRYLTELLTIYSLNEATVITDWVFETTLHSTRAQMVKNPLLLVNGEDLHVLNTHLTELLEYKPVQYVLGEAWFYKLKLKVDKNVLIPRPETEELVKLVIDKYQSLLALNPTILDIGTGSGCIAIALKNNLPTSLITAIDNSEGALKIAKENALAHQVAIQFREVDFLDEDRWRELPSFDVIISNPPYIPLNEKEKLDKNVVEFEPPEALFVPDKTPLLFYEKIAAFGKKHLNKNGIIYVETHENLAEQTAAVFSATYLNVKVISDIFEKKRMVTASTPIIHFHLQWQR